jgi:hypothetical protein
MTGRIQFIATPGDRGVMTPTLSTAQTMSTSLQEVFSPIHNHKKRKSQLEPSTAVSHRPSKKTTSSVKSSRSQTSIQNTKSTRTSVPVSNTSAWGLARLLERVQTDLMLGSSKWFQCPQCGLGADRDIHAVRNILLRFLK